MPVKNVKQAILPACLPLRLSGASSPSSRSSRTGRSSRSSAPPLPPNGQPMPPLRTVRTLRPSPKTEDVEDQEDAAACRSAPGAARPRADGWRFVHDHRMNFGFSTRSLAKRAKNAEKFMHIVVAGNSGYFSWRTLRSSREIIPGVDTNQKRQRNCRTPKTVQPRSY